MSSTKFKNEAIVKQLIIQGKVDVVEPSVIEANRQFEEAKAHVQSAQTIIDTDVAGAFQLTYDAARKALQAVLLASGLRVATPPRGNHFVFVELTQCSVLTDQAWATLRWMRELRNTTEYPIVGQLTAQREDANQAISAARAMLAEAALLLK